MGGERVLMDYRDIQIQKNIQSNVMHILLYP